MEMLQKLKALVRVEAKKLKENATPEELDRLDIDNLMSTQTDRCIYGQMTGDCYSLRADQLIIACATRVYNCNGGLDKDDLHRLNGKPYEANRRRFIYHSPIELFILINQSYEGNIGNNIILIDYLKGKRKSLRFV